MTTIFDKASAIIEKLQTQEWRPSEHSKGRYITSINLADYTSSTQEAVFLSRVLDMIINVMPGVYPGTCGADIPHTSYPVDLTVECSLVWDKTESDPAQRLQHFKQDNSLGLKQQPRPMTPNFQPQTVQQAVDFVRWMESTRWAQGKIGDDFRYAMCYSHGVRSGMMFFSHKDVNMVNQHFRETNTDPVPPPPADWVCINEDNMRYPDKRNIPQIWTNDNQELHVGARDARALLVDFIGLDAKILGLETKERLP